MDGDQGDPARGRVQQRVDLPGEGGRGGPIADAVTCDGGPGSESRAEGLTSALRLAIIISGWCPVATPSHDLSS